MQLLSKSNYLKSHIFKNHTIIREGYKNGEVYQYKTLKVNFDLNAWNTLQSDYFYKMKKILDTGGTTD